VNVERKKKLFFFAIGCMNVIIVVVTNTIRLNHSDRNADVVVA